MIKIEYTDHPEYLSLVFKGHADFAGPGEEDIVCSAATMMAVSLIEHLKKEKDEMEKAPVHHVQKGYADICCQADDLSRYIFDFVYLGLIWLSNNYPENVEVKKIIIMDDGAND